MPVGRIIAEQGDIIRAAVDVIVNAANSSLLGGGGVDGAIHRAAGPRLLAECRTLGGCPAGEARITGAYDLPHRHVIHTVGPIWYGGSVGEAGLLASCYRNSLRLAVESGARSVAFPGISTGAYGYPIPAATEIAVRTVRAFLTESSAEIDVMFCCFSAEALGLYQSALSD
ncbi:MAG: O-acetyl-ADP-ribose deacetylase [Hyphomonadaceae bacterium]